MYYFCQTVKNMLSIIFFFCIIILVIRMDYKLMSYNERDTAMIAENIESEKFPNMVICLMGDLGSGKTVFVKAFAASLGIKEDITSPTFNIIKEYQEAELPLYHMDVYRLEDQEEDLGIEDYYEKGGVTIIEWADMIKDKLPEERLDIKFKIIDENTRVLVLIPHGHDYEDICGVIS